MSFSKDLHWIDPKAIKILPDRQRRGEIKIDDLIPSIKERGLINPVILTAGFELIAGERRTRAAIAAGLELIPYRLDGELDELGRQIVELEENERRQDLHWMDQVRAIGALHGLYAKRALDSGEKWSASRTSEMLFYDNSHILHVLRVFKDLDNPKIAQAPGMRAAYNILSRYDDRRIGDAMSAIAGAGATVTAPAQPAVVPPPVNGKALPVVVKPPEPEKPRLPAEELDIVNIAFKTWLETYEGARFNFVHCDFPYGVNLFGGEQGGKDKWRGYDDDPNIYWELIRLFCAERDRFMSQSAHMMFWLSADIDIMQDTIELFAKLAPELRFVAKPLIWHKTNNVGVLSDPKRGPRHIYETCLIASRDDRFIVKATSDLYGSQTDKDHHPSTKPEPMLRYFFQMFVDEHTEIFDPTCGSGAALRAAESLGAKRVLGLEIDKEHCDNARSALRQFRAKARAAASMRKP